MGTAMRQGTAQKRLGTAMNSNKGAGYPSNKKKETDASGKYLQVESYADMRSEHLFMIFGILSIERF